MTEQEAYEERELKRAQERRAMLIEAGALESGRLVAEKVIREIGGLVSEADVLGKSITVQENKLKEDKRNLQILLEKAIPDAMMEAGISTITTTEGASVELKDILRASIPKPRLTEAIAWLEEYGQDDIVKSVVSASFARGEGDLSQKLLAFCEAEGFSAAQKQSVHTQTLSALIRDMDGETVTVMEEEKVMNFPRDMFGVYEAKVAKITQA